MNTTATAAKLTAALVDAEAVLKATTREESRTAGIADRAAARAKTARTEAAAARRELLKAQRTGKGVPAAARRAEARTAKAEALTAAAAEAKAVAGAARRAARTAGRRVDSLSLRTARTAARMVGKIADRLGRTALTAAPAADRTLPAEELPAVEVIEARAEEFAELDAQAKAYAKSADAVKKWLRQLPVGVFGRVTVTRTPGGTVIDGDQVAIDYLDAGLGVPPRKGRKDTFKIAVTAEAPLLAVAA
ncbi:hypothetical protein [Streptomyces sp. G1]|uniref:hypothetical protein n=1 Tax=Streptomyces sp. G1 TaxID=361572 RepID=UPI00202EAFEC|nr:hypothetical protein [Streptomyces sp. G1]MCM1964870.1 hypothetical protein [Streptomyces sp. G1]